MGYHGGDVWLHARVGRRVQDANPSEYSGLVLPGGRAPEFLRYDNDFIRITKHFFEHNKPVASICHGIEILAAAQVFRDRGVTTIPRCKLGAEFAGATYLAAGFVVDGNLLCCRFKKDCAAWDVYTFLYSEMTDNSLIKLQHNSGVAGENASIAGFMFDLVPSIRARYCC